MIPSTMTPSTSPLTTDLYELNMVQAYLDHGENNEAVFEFFVRKLPPRRGFLLAAGLEDALHYLETIKFSDAEIAWLKSTGRFRDNLIDYLKNFRFTGDVHAIPEGTVCFAPEPLLRITAPLPQAQLVESRLINILHFQTLIASKAARMVLAAPGKALSDFESAAETQRRRVFARQPRPRRYQLLGSDLDVVLPVYGVARRMGKINRLILVDFVTRATDG